MSYEFYKILHITFIGAFFMSMGATLFGARDKILKIVSGISTVLILVAGMGLLARLGISHRGPWPLWAILKLGLWIFLGCLGPVISKRAPQYGKKVFWLYLLGLALAVAIIQYKP